MLAAVAAIAVGSASTSVSAQDAAAAAQNEGSWSVGGGLGPGFYLNGGSAGFNLEFSAGYAFMDRLWGVFTPSFLFGGGTTLITVPVGVQYDVEIPSVPNLFVYPRVSIGIGFATAGGSARFAFIPEAGVKYVIQGKYYIGFEPFSLPIYFGDPTVTVYKLTFLGGMYF